MKLSQTLLNADQSLQITGKYLEQWNQDTKKAKGYCAVGYLACQSKSVHDGFIGNEALWLKSKYELTQKQLDEIIECKACKRGDTVIEGTGCNAKHPFSGALVALIVHLNDAHEYPFKDIGEYLQEEGY